ncbi:MAG TPA: bifunctional 5,10-methylenetetrahydrofolate dehydrogenase/5,10-methenyltetrahydrofolate cyclohydrolase [Candidatus Paceibacterota bacterium]
MAKLLDGKMARQARALSLKAEIEKMGAKPTLAIIQVGDRAESSAYIEAKKKFGKEIGAIVIHIQCPTESKTSEIQEKIDELNENPKINGIILQLPVPPSIDAYLLVEKIDPSKDVDGQTGESMRRLLRAERGFIPATPKGIFMLLDFYGIPVEGKHIVIIGRSYLVGKPAGLLGLNRNATVTICHSKTSNLQEISKSADIVIAAAGQPGLIDKNFVRTGQVIIDVGINEKKGGHLEEIAGRRLVGDVNFADVEPIVEAISPVPGGVGPMTVCALFENLVLAATLQQNSK